MDTLQMLGSTLGLSFLAGMRLYATVLALGIGIHYHLFRLPQAMSGLEVLAHPGVMITAGVAFVAEFVADKVPWFDSIWDSIHTFIRPIGAALLGATALAQMDPAMRVGLALVCGGVALTSHSSKAATRAVANTSPEPFSNIALSLAGDAIAPVGVWVAMNHPLVALACVIVATVVAFLLARLIVRKLRASIGRLLGHREEAQTTLPA